MAMSVECKVGNSPNVLYRRLDRELEVNSCSGMLVHHFHCGRELPALTPTKSQTHVKEKSTQQKDMCWVMKYCRIEQLVAQGASL